MSGRHALSFRRYTLLVHIQLNRGPIGSRTNLEKPEARGHPGDQGLAECNLMIICKIITLITTLVQNVLM